MSIVGSAYILKPAPRTAWCFGQPYGGFAARYRRFSHRSGVTVEERMTNGRRKISGFWRPRIRRRYRITQAACAVHGSRQRPAS